jgi:hypothetical protein
MDSGGEAIAAEVFKDDLLQMVEQHGLPREILPIADRDSVVAAK